MTTREWESADLLAERRPEEPDDKYVEDSLENLLQCATSSPLLHATPTLTALRAGSRSMSSSRAELAIFPSTP